MGEVIMNLHFGGKMEFEPVVRYVGGDKHVVQEEMDYIGWFSLKDLMGLLGYEEPKMVWYRIPVLTLGDGLRPIFSDKEMLEMASTGINHESIDIYVEANKKSCGVNGCSMEDFHCMVTQENNGVMVPQDTVQGEENDLNDEVVPANDHDSEDNNEDYLPIQDTDSEGYAEGECIFSDNDDEEYIQATQNKKNMKSILQEEHRSKELRQSFGAAENQAALRSTCPKDSEGEVELSGNISDYDESDGDVSTPVLSEDEEQTIHAGKKKIKALVYDPNCDHGNLKFEVGMRFNDNKQFKDAVIKYAICNGLNIRWVRSCQKRMEARCKDGCKWRIHGSWMQRELTFIVKKLVKGHNCSRSLRNRQANAAWLAREYLHQFRSNPNWSVSEMEKDVHEKYALTISRSVCYRGKWKALSMLRGSLYEHYKLLLSYIAELRKAYRLGTFELVTEAQSLVISDQTQIVDRVFKRMYIGFDELKQGFLQGCRPVIGLDGCFLKTFLGGQLLTAVARDGNNQMFPISWAVVEGENESSWSWFINILTEDLGIIDGHGYTIISDQQKGLVKAVRERMPLAEHRNCARHIYANWKKQHSGQILKALFWSAVRSTTKADYRDALTKMEAVKFKAADDFKKVGVSRFCKLYINTTCKCDNVDNNMSETFNGYILKSRARPIVEMLEEIRTSLMERMQVKRSLMVNELEGSVCPRIKKKLDTLRWDSRLCVPQHSTDMSFQVEVRPNFLENPNQLFSYNRFVVDLNLHTCSCKKWQLTGIPCAHVISCINWLRDDVDKYVDDYYKKEKYLTTYSFPLKPLRGPREWPVIEQGSLLPPPYKKMPGRPKKIRVREEGERSNNTGTFSRRGLQMQCKMCKEYGHNKRTCPLKHNSSANTTSNAIGSSTTETANSQAADQVHLERQSVQVGNVGRSESQSFVLQQGKLHPPCVGHSGGKVKQTKRGRPPKDVNTSSRAPKRHERIIQRELREVRKGVGLYKSPTTGNMYFVTPGGTVCQPYPGRILQTRPMDGERHNSLRSVPITAPGTTDQPSAESVSQSGNHKEKGISSNYIGAIKQRLGVTSSARREDIIRTSEKSVIIDGGDWE